MCYFEVLSEVRPVGEAPFADFTPERSLTGVRAQMSPQFVLIVEALRTVSAVVLLLLDR